MAKKKPIGAPSCGKEPYRARLRAGAFSVASSAAAVKRFLIFRRALYVQQRRTAPFAAQSQTLAEARQRQQHRCKNTNALVAGQQADNHRGDPHGQQRSDQRDLTANAIAEVAKQRGADRPGDEGDGEGGERL